jgi:hypothetical protein
MRALYFIPLLACHEFNLNAEDAATGASDTGAEEFDTDGGSDTANSDNEPYVAVWYSIAARLNILDGYAGLSDAEVRFALGDAGLARQDCAPLDLSGLSIVETPTSGQYHQWNLTVPADTGCDAEGLVLPDSVGIGIGPLDPEVRAQLGTVGLDSEADSLWGAYFAPDAGSFVAFGYAIGAENASASGPPPDGTYLLEPLLLQRVPAAE